MKAPSRGASARLSSDEAQARKRLGNRGLRVAARSTKLQTITYMLGNIAVGKETSEVAPIRPSSVALEPESQRKVASDLFNYVWTLLEKGDRTPREDDLMIHAAHAARFFWDDIGEPLNHARGEWQIARVYSVLERPEPALYHAQRCLEICEQHGIGDFDIAYAYEGMARALAAAGDTTKAARYEALAREAARDISDGDDRELLLSDLDTLSLDGGEGD